MFGNLIRLGLTCSVAMAMFASCEHQDFTNTYEDVDRVQVNHISDEMAKVRDYVPRMAVIATVALHSGLLKKLRLLIVGLVKWAPTIWKQTCNAQKTESYWHFMTTTSAVQQTLKTYTARASRLKYGVHSIKSTTK